MEFKRNELKRPITCALQHNLVTNHTSQTNIPQSLETNAASWHECMGANLESHRSNVVLGFTASRVPCKLQYADMSGDSWTLPSSPATALSFSLTSNLRSQENWSPGLKLLDPTTFQTRIKSQHCHFSSSGLNLQRYQNELLLVLVQTWVINPRACICWSLPASVLWSRRLYQQKVPNTEASQ